MKHLYVSVMQYKVNEGSTNDLHMVASATAGLELCAGNHQRRGHQHSMLAITGCVRAGCEFTISRRIWYPVDDGHNNDT